jgi:hypothetical protein
MSGIVKKKNGKKNHRFAVIFWLAIFAITLLLTLLIHSAGRLTGAGLRDDNNQLQRADANTSNYFPPQLSDAGRWHSSHRPAESNQPLQADNNIETLPAKAAGEVSHGTKNQPLLFYDWLDDVVEKIHFVESSGRLNPPDGDGGRAVGALQLHKCVVDDVNRHYQTNFSYADRRDFPKARLIAQLYIAWWMHIHKEEIACRIFNGGPRGWRKQSTDAYWEKIKGAQ